MRSADRRTNVQIEEKPEGNTQCQSPDKSVDTAVGSFADQNAIAFYPSSDSTCQASIPEKNRHPKSVLLKIERRCSILRWSHSTRPVEYSCPQRHTRFSCPIVGPP